MYQAARHSLVRSSGRPRTTAACSGIGRYPRNTLGGRPLQHGADTGCSIAATFATFADPDPSLAAKLKESANRPFSSFSEPEPTLFGKMITSTDATNSANDDDPENAQLRNDIRVMGSVLGKVIVEHQGVEIFDKVEAMRAMAKQWRADGCSDDDASFAKLAEFASALTQEELYAVSRSFTHFLAIANAAESHHRSRRIQQATSTESFGALYPKNDSCGGAIPNLLKDGHSVEKIHEALCSQTTELVLTAHPTEVNRRTILEKKRRIRQILVKADTYRAVGNQKKYDLDQLDDAMYREISSVWLSDEVSRFKPTPVQEAEKGTLVLETVLWEAVPDYLRKLDATAKEFLGKGLPLDSAPIKFASWMGGDRDGNPNVKPNTTRQVCLNNRRKAGILFYKDLQRLIGQLSTTTCSEELRSVVGDAREPYRAAIAPMIEKLQLTIDWANQELDFLQKQESGNLGASAAHTKLISEEDIYLKKEDFMNDLLMIHRSLRETDNALAADGILSDILRNLSAFGLTLIPLDVRQESDRHEEALDSVTRFLGLGSYSQWDEETKISWLTSQISSRRPLLRDGVWHEHPDIFSPTAVDTLEIFRMIAEQHEDSLGAYVISQATSASDVLAVLLLQLDAGVKKPLRVAPLFETLDDLNGASSTMKKLFSLPVYMGVINGKQEVMIGYSDSAKDAGRLAASWAQYETQEELAKVARDYNIEMSFFHGKGGTVGRGGNPQGFLGIMAHAPNTINGQFRVTEQGEMINQNLGFKDRAERTMDIYTAAILSEKLTKRPSPSSEWRDMMHKLSEVSCASYRKIVREDERFVPYFRSATPELELSGLNIGSRPAKRKAGGGVESLRAIPWIFAWTQTRLNLPTWLGVGEAVSWGLKSDKASLLQEMYRDWGTFRTMIDLVEMVLAKSEPAIAKHYDDMLVKEDLAKELGAEVRSVHLGTEKAILDLTGHTVLGGNNKILMRALQVRNPYVDCLNILQAETLKRIRRCEEGQEGKILKDALMTTITGVANGMGNTG